MLIKNGLVFGENGVFSRKNVRTDGAFFAPEKMWPDGERAKEEVLDAEGLYVLPGLVDIHLHGCAGFDFCDGTDEAFDAITAYEASRGVTSLCPATMTLAEDTLARIFAQAGRYINDTGSRILGITMEGPFVSAAKKGAQNEAYIKKPDLHFFRTMQRLCGGKIAQVALAPEEDREFAFLRAIKDETTVSVAHTTADYDTAAAAFAAGAGHVTHLFNAMLPFTHREPGVAGAAFDSPQTYVELICDGVHVHPSMVRAAFRLFGRERVCMISDSMMATGQKDGSYALGGQPVTVTGRRAVLLDGTIAGSVTDLMGCLQRAVKEMGISFADAVYSCTATPARSLGFYDRCGSISAGKYADAVILDSDFHIVHVICRGRLLQGGHFDK